MAALGPLGPLSPLASWVLRAFDWERSQARGAFISQWNRTGNANQ
jgi:hypothetical protein